MAHAPKIRRQDVLTKAAHKFCLRQGHRFGIAPRLVILVMKRNPLIINTLYAVIRDSHLVRVTSQILNHRLRSTERTLRINNPLVLVFLQTPTNIKNHGWV